jgi:hypothetical protein
MLANAPSDSRLPIEVRRAMPQRRVKMAALTNRSAQFITVSNENNRKINDLRARHGTRRPRVLCVLGVICVLSVIGVALRPVRGGHLGT